MYAERGLPVGALPDEHHFHDGDYVCVCCVLRPGYDGRYKRPDLSCRVDSAQPASHHGCAAPCRFVWLGVHALANGWAPSAEEGSYRPKSPRETREAQVP